MASGPGDEDEVSSFQVVVKTMFGEYFDLAVTDTDTVKLVKQKITNKLNIPEEGFTLLYNTRFTVDPLAKLVSSNVLYIQPPNVMILVNYACVRPLWCCMVSYNFMMYKCYLSIMVHH